MAAPADVGGISGAGWLTPGDGLGEFGALSFGTLLALEWGYGFRGVNGNGTLGTQVVRISAFKVF